MNIIKVYGGLGNQLFQYALGRIQKEHGIDVYYDISWKDDGKTITTLSRPYRLDKFGLQLPHAINRRLHLFKEKGYNKSIPFFNGYNFIGYWQYYSYFNEYKHLLRDEIKLCDKYITDEFITLRDSITSVNSVSLHVRRGDYVTHGGSFRELPFRYYIDALKEGSGELFIFSDEIDWCKDKFKDDYFERKITFITLDDYLSFELMRYCNTNIISNSTFSWWAAYLNYNDNKVVCPKHWLSDPEENGMRYPIDWIRVEDYVR